MSSKKEVFREKCSHCNQLTELKIVSEYIHEFEMGPTDPFGNILRGYETETDYHRWYIALCPICQKPTFIEVFRTTLDQMNDFNDAGDPVWPFKKTVLYPKSNQNLNEFSEMTRKIKNVITEVSTGITRIQDENDGYQLLFEQLDKEYVKNGVQNPNEFSDLWEFHHYWKENLPSYSDRRDYIIKLYKRQPQGKVTSTDDFWRLIHNQIVNISKPRFENNLYADSVEAAFKGVNSRVKRIVKDKSGTELDGSKLMKKAFSISDPIIKLADISTESGKSTQIGYMELFSGAMTGIRNPKAHENMKISKENAIHLLFLASLLMNKLDEAIKED